jgi:hypothetical protein
LPGVPRMEVKLDRTEEELDRMGEKLDRLLAHLGA